MDLGQLFTDKDDQDSNRHIPEQRVSQDQDIPEGWKVVWADWLEEEERQQIETRTQIPRLENLTRMEKQKMKQERAMADRFLGGWKDSGC